MARKRTEAAAEPRQYKVAYPHGLNLRAEPSKTADIVRVLPHGEAVTARDADAPKGWIAVDGGYVMREFLE